MLTTKPPIQPMAGPPPPPGQPNRAAVQSAIGPNLIFTVFASYWVATILQDIDLKLGLIIAIGLAGGHLAVGTLLLFVNARRVYPYVLELAMLCIYAPLLGVSLASDGGAQNIQRNYNFIVHSALAGVTLISMVVTYPLGLQHVQEMVPWAHCGHDRTLKAGYWTSGVFAFAFIASCLLYIIPLESGDIYEPKSALNLVFRIILPCVLTFLAVLFARFWPSWVVSELQATEVYDDWTGPKVMLTYPPAAATMNRPMVLDSAMLEPYPQVKLPGAYGAALGQPGQHQRQQGLAAGQQQRAAPGSTQLVLQPGANEVGVLVPVSGAGTGVGRAPGTLQVRNNAVMPVHMLSSSQFAAPSGRPTVEVLVPPGQQPSGAYAPPGHQQQFGMPAQALHGQAPGPPAPPPQPTFPLTPAAAAAANALLRSPPPPRVPPVPGAAYVPLPEGGVSRPPGPPPLSPGGSPYASMQTSPGAPGMYTSYSAQNASATPPYQSSVASLQQAQQPQQAQGGAQTPTKPGMFSWFGKKKEQQQQQQQQQQTQGQAQPPQAGAMAQMQPGMQSPMQQQQQQQQMQGGTQVPEKFGMLGWLGKKKEQQAPPQQQLLLQGQSPQMGAMPQMRPVGMPPGMQQPPQQPSSAAMQQQPMQQAGGTAEPQKSAWNFWKKSTPQ